MNDFYVTDPSERGENAAEDWYFKNVENGIAKCACGKKFILETAESLSSDPYAIPVCSDCFRKAVKR